MLGEAIINSVLKIKIIFLSVAHFYLDFPPSSDVANVAKLQATVTIQGIGFPSTTGQHFGTFGAALRGTLRVWGSFYGKHIFLMYL